MKALNRMLRNGVCVAVDCKFPGPCTNAITDFHLGRSSKETQMDLIQTMACMETDRITSSPVLLIF